MKKKEVDEFQKWVWEHVSAWGGRMNGCLVLDPSTVSTGWAYWTTKAWLATGPTPPTEVGLLTASGEDWRARVQDIVCDFEGLLADCSPALVLSEMPQSFGTGNIASMNAGAVLKLTYLVGALHCSCMGAQTFCPVAVTDWKGNLPKAVVIDRIKNVYGLQPLLYRQWRDDIWDAVGIGLWAQGRL